MRASIGIMLITLLLSIPAHAAVVTEQDTGLDVIHDEVSFGPYVAFELTGYNVLFAPAAFTIQASSGNRLKTESSNTHPDATKITSRGVALPSTQPAINHEITLDTQSIALSDERTPTLLGQASDWLASAGEIALEIESNMTAFTQFDEGTGTALVDKKFTSAELTTASSVPEPNAWSSLSAGLFVLGVMVSRRKQHFYK
jgi:hypothetical protein